MKLSLISRSLRRGSAVGWLLLILVVAVAGISYYIYMERAEKARIAMLDRERLAREKEAREAALKIIANLQQQNMELWKNVDESIRLAHEAWLREEEARRLAEARRRAGEHKPSKVEVTPVDQDKKDPRVAVFDKSVALSGIAAGKKGNMDRMNEVLNVACDTNEWNLFKAFLEKNIKDLLARVTRMKEFNMEVYSESPLMPQAVAIYNLIKTLPEETLVELNEAVEGGDSFLKYILTNKDNSLINLSRAATGSETGSDWERYLRTWHVLWKKSSPEWRAKYQPLAIACSIVREDQLGGCQTIGQTPMDIVQVYDRFCASAEAGKLKTDITKMEPSDLIYVVNVRLPYSEMEWAQKNVHLSRKKWSSAYPMVHYLMERATQNKNPYKEYTLKEILKEGGVCRDQGYFAVNTARCNGIPAAYVTGDGNRGPHAWFVYMDSATHWQSAGGYGYTSGMTSDPQTGKRVHESLFAMRSDPKTSGSRNTQMRDLLTMSNLLKDFGLDDAAWKLLARAREIASTHPLPWEMSIDFMKNKEPKPTTEQWKEMSDSIRKKFKNRPDFLSLAEEIDEEFVRPFQDSSDTAKALARERRQLDRSTKDGRADLSVQSLRRQVDHLLEGEKNDEVNTLFKKALRDYSGKLDTLSSVMDMYWGFAKDNPKYTNQALSSMERIYRSKVEMGGDYFKISQEVRLQKKLGNFFIEAGDDRKGEKIIKKAEQRLETAKKNA